MVHYEKYQLSQPITVQAIESADYILGPIADDEIHVHTDAWELCCCLQGQIYVQKCSEHLTLQAGNVLFLPPKTEHKVSSREPDAITFALSFTCSGDNHLRLLQDSVVSAGGGLRMILHNIRDELEMSFLQEDTELHWMKFVPNAQSPFGAEQMISCYLEQFIIRLLRSVTMEQGKVVSGVGFHEAAQRYLAEQVILYIRSHLDEHLTAEQLAKAFHYSRVRLTAICKQVTSMGVNELIAQERINAAKVLLLEQQKTVAQISQELGFSTPHYFSYKFKQLVGCAPSFYAEWSSRQPQSQTEHPAG